MLVALGVILVVFHLWSGGTFLRPENMMSLAVQASGIAVISTGMVLVIVSRNIDLSVGSLVGIVAMTYAVLMTQFMPDVMGIGPDFPFRWVIALLMGMGLGLGIGALQGFIIAYIGVPSFVVTLGGLLSIRGAVWYFSRGAAVSGLDHDFQLLGGGATGALGGPMTWLVAGVAAAAIIALLYYNRRQRRRFGFPLRPMWAETLVGSLGVLFVLGLAWLANTNYWPKGLAEAYAHANNIPIPPGGLLIPTGFPYPIVIVIAVTLVMTWVATRRRFGRYVYAYGGNPDAAKLAGINTRWTIMKTFMLIGVLCALAACDRRRPPERGHARHRRQLRALRHCRGGHRRDIVCRRHRHHPGRRAGCLRDAVDRLWPELRGRQLTRPERRRRHRAHPRRRLR